jgi:hypothetical protein
MQDLIELPTSVIGLMTYVDNAGWTESAELVVQILMAGVHPDFECPVATAALLPSSVRMDVADFFNKILVGALTDGERGEIFSWTQLWALGSKLSDYG